MIEVILTGISCALFAWFLNFAVYDAPFLKWYGRFLDWLPEYLSKPLGGCPFCFSPWLTLICLYAPIPQEAFYPVYAFGWVYLTNRIYDRFIDPTV